MLHRIFRKCTVKAKRHVTKENTVMWRKGMRIYIHIHIYKYTHTGKPKQLQMDWTRICNALCRRRWGKDKSRGTGKSHYLVCSCVVMIWSKCYWVK
jgi:hypothetical protein